MQMCALEDQTDILIRLNDLVDRFYRAVQKDKRLEDYLPFTLHPTYACEWKTTDVGQNSKSEIRQLKISYNPVKGSYVMVISSEDRPTTFTSIRLLMYRPEDNPLTRSGHMVPIAVYNWLQLRIEEREKYLPYLL